jgi:hypothetical protein
MCSNALHNKPSGALMCVVISVSAGNDAPALTTVSFSTSVSGNKQDISVGTQLSRKLQTWK